jgi:uncharacterized protein (TIGR00251 family)
MKPRVQVKIKARAVLRINVAAPPVDGKANLEVIRLIADLAKVAKSQVRIIMGETNPMKVIEIDGIERDEFLRRIE